MQKVISILFVLAFTPSVFAQPSKRAVAQTPGSDEACSNWEITRVNAKHKSSELVILDSSNHQTLLQFRPTGALLLDRYDCFNLEGYPRKLVIAVWRGIPGAAFVGIFDPSLSKLLGRFSSGSPLNYDSPEDTKVSQILIYEAASEDHPEGQTFSWPSKDQPLQEPNAPSAK